MCIYKYRYRALPCSNPSLWIGLNQDFLQFFTSPLYFPFLFLCVHYGWSCNTFRPFSCPPRVPSTALLYQFWGKKSEVYSCKWNLGKQVVALYSSQAIWVNCIYLCHYICAFWRRELMLSSLEESQTPLDDVGAIFLS